MELIKLKDKSNGAIIEVKKSLAGDYIGTGKFVLVQKEDKVKEPIKIEQPKEEKIERKIKFGKNN